MKFVVLDGADSQVEVVTDQFKSDVDKTEWLG